MQPQLQDPERVLNSGPLRFEHVLKCPLCQNDGFSEYMNLEVEGLVLDQCDACGLIFLNPRLDEGFMNRYYERVYWGDRQLMRVAQGGSGSLAERVHEYFKRRDVRQYYRSRERILDRYCREQSLLEIGCGEGSFLTYLAARGWDARGIDISVAKAPGARLNPQERIVYGDFVAMPIPAERYENIGAFHLLEHLYQPRIALHRIFRLLKPGGFLFVEVPCIGSLQARMFGGGWSELAVPVHVNFFTPATLRGMLQSEGFDLVHMSHRPSFHSLSAWRISLIWRTRRFLAATKILIGSKNRRLVPRARRNDHPYYELLVSGRSFEAAKPPKLSHELFYRCCLNPLLSACTWIEWSMGKASVITACAQKPV